MTRFGQILIRSKAAAAVPESSSPLTVEFNRDAAAIASERDAAISQLGREYAGQLDVLARELSEQGRAAIAAAARAEKARVEVGGEIAEEALSRAPFEVLSARALYLEKRRVLARDYDARIAQRAARYLSALEKAAVAPGSEEAMAARAFLEKERKRLPHADQPIVQRIVQRTPSAGGDGGGPFEEVAEDDALLSGLLLYTGDFADHDVLVALQPIFRTADATRPGNLHGVPRGAAVKLEAEEGYAVGELHLHAGDRVDGLEIVFMKIKPDRRALDPADSYRSKWVGGKGGAETEISGDGNAIIGLYGATGSEFDSLGLIKLMEPGAPAPKPLCGANIFCLTPKKYLGIAEYKITAPGRVHVACNFNYQDSRSGGWFEERRLGENFLNNGRNLAEGVELQSWGSVAPSLSSRRNSQPVKPAVCAVTIPSCLITFNP